MSLKTNNAEGGSDTTVVTTGNSGGGSGNAFNTVGGTSFTFSATQKAHGALSYAFTPAAAAASWALMTDSTVAAAFSVRMYNYLTGYPTSETNWLSVQQSGGTAVAYLNLQTNGRLKLSGPGGTLYTFTNAIPLNSQVRLTLFGTVGASTTTGTVTARMYLGDSGTVIEEAVLTNINTGTVNPGRVIYGKFTATGNMTTYYLDDIAQDLASSTEFPAVNIPPVANAGTDQSVGASVGVTLNGTASADSDGTISSYSWAQLSGTSVTLSSSSAVSPTFTSPALSTTLVFELTVTDNQGATHADQVTVTVTSSNVPPVANAGIDQSVLGGASVTLNGSSSSDSDGTIANYAWSQTAGTTVTLSGSGSNRTFTAPAGPETLTFQLTVTDDDGATHSDSVNVVVGAEVVHVGNGVVGGLTSSATWADFPVVHSANDRLVLYAITNSSASPTTDHAPFVKIATTPVGDGLYGHVWTKISAGTESGHVVVTATGSTVGAAWQMSYRGPAGVTPSIQILYGVDTNSTSTLMEGNSSTSWAVQVGDRICAAVLAKAPSGTFLDGIFTATGIPTLGGGATTAAPPTQRFGGLLAGNATSFSHFDTRISGAGSGTPGFTGIANGANASGMVLLTKLSATNIPPVANAGTDYNVTVSTAGATLDGSASSDVDGYIATYAWSQLSGTAVTLSGSGAGRTFTAPASTGALVFRLTVTDDLGATHTDDITVTVTSAGNTPPVAVAGSDQAALPGDTVTLNGSSSTDSDGTITTYAWVQTSGTPTVSLSGTGHSRTFTAPSKFGGTTLVFQLTVTDDDGATHSDSMSVVIASGTLYFWQSGVLKAAQFEM